MRINVVFNKNDGTSTTVVVLVEKEDTILGKRVLIWDIEDGTTVIAYKDIDPDHNQYVGQISMNGELHFFLGETLELLVLGMFRLLADGKV